MFYILLLFTIIITVSGLQLGLRKCGFSKLSTVVMIAMPSFAWTYIIWQEFTPSNFYVGLIGVVIIFEVSLFVSRKLAMRFSMIEKGGIGVSEHG
jgi:hypothetical protein